MGTEPVTPVGDAQDLLSAVLIAALVVVVVLLAAVTLGWTPTDGSSFGITADPAGNLPY
jgi:hypothetical protein